MRKDLYSSKPQSDQKLRKTAFRINIGIGLTMGIIAFGGMLGPSWPLRARPCTQCEEEFNSHSKARCSFRDWSQLK